MQVFQTNQNKSLLLTKLFGSYRETHWGKLFLPVIATIPDPWFSKEL